MVFLTAGAGWLALMMRAERTRAGHDVPNAEWSDTDWLLQGSSGSDIEEDDAPLLAAE